MMSKFKLSIFSRLFFEYNQNVLVNSRSLAMVILHSLVSIFNLIQNFKNYRDQTGLLENHEYYAVRL